MARVIWTSGGSRDLLRLIDFLADENLAAAARAAVAINHKVKILRTMPLVGRAASFAGYRELIIKFGSVYYILLYK